MNQTNTSRRQLNHFERLMFWDQSEDYPMVFCVRLRLRHLMTLSDLRDAIQRALTVHPMLNSTVDDSGDYWRSENELPVEINVVANFDRHPKPLDLQEKRGLRVAMLQSKNGTQLQFDFHHAATDGLGALSFLKSVFADRLPESTSEDICAKSMPAGNEKRASRLSRFVDFSRMMATAPRALASGNRGTNDEESLNSRCLSRATTKGYLRAAKEQGVTVNDLLVRDLMLTLSNWNRTRGKSLIRPIRVLTPINVRKNMNDPAARNEIGYWFASRRPACWKPDALLKSLNAEFSKVKQRGLNTAFEGFLKRLMQLPAMNRKTFSNFGRICFASAVLSNLGVIDQRLPVDSTGASVINDIALAPPVRAHTWAAFLVYTRNDQLNLNLRHAPEGMSGSDATGLLTRLGNSIQRTAAPYIVDTSPMEATAIAG